MTLQSTRRQTGMTIVELMIALLLSLLLAGGIIAVFVNNSHSFNQDENLARMQDDARHALREIAFDLSMAGHYADMFLPHIATPDPTLSIGTDCGPSGDVNWMYRLVDPASDNTLSVTSVDNATGTMAAARHSCIASGEFLDGTDIVSIKRVAGTETAALETGAVYLRTNGTVGLMYRAPLPVTPAITVTPPLADWEFRPRIYYIRRFANTPGDNTPTLCRKILTTPGPSMTTECLATGIEDLQIEYGLDTTGDGNPNLYSPNPTLDEIQDVVSARIHILARTTEVDTRYTNTKVFSISNAPAYSPADSFHRRVFTTTVAIQNMRSLNMMGF